MDAFWAAPPVTRSLVAAAVLFSCTVYSGILNPYYVVFIRRFVLKLPVPQLWRLITPFFLTGPKLGIVLDPYFIYTYGSVLETESSRFSQPGDFLVYLLFIAGVVLITGGFLLQSILFLQPLILALAYTYAQDNPTRRITFYIVTFQVKYLPYAMLLMTFVMSSPNEALHQGTGLFAAHLYDFLTRIWPTFGGGRNPIRTPQAIRRWFVKPPGAGTQRGYGTAFQGRPAGSQGQTAGSGRTGGWTSGFSSGSWGSMGPGRRLGGD
ncbi:hypothetical protein M8818_002672 [Zalaria obscura]|uniref:Uncharacterized protein n=1 Tax=Zalaria obscura TaxID=2024903 RepID=A0ACC3SGZ1_9PEZI